MSEKERPEGLMMRILARVERVGNRLPDPVTLFVALMALVLVTSLIANLAGVSATHPGTGEEIHAVNLLDREGLQRILGEMVHNFAAFPPLGLVLVAMLGIGVAERSGLVAAALEAFVARVPRKLLTTAIVTAGMLSSLAADAGYVVLVPLGAVLFYGAGRHPIAGLAAAFAGVSGGFSANLVLTSLDPLLAGFTEPAAQLLDTNYTVDPTANWYLMAAFVPIFALTGTWVTESVIIPRLGEYEGEPELEEGAEERPPVDADRRRRGLRAAGIVFVVATALVIVAALPSPGLLRDDEGTLMPLIESIVPLMFVFFFLPGLAYGISVGVIRNDKDAAKMTGDTMASMGAYIVLAFVAAQFVAYFAWSNLGVIVAISGAKVLEAIGLSGLPLLIAFVVVSSIINLFIGSASAKWAIMAPIFVPMLMLMGYSPEVTQAAYRLGDSVTNVLTPLLPYFPLILIFAQRYDKKFGIGTLVATMLPFSIGFLVVGSITLTLWVAFGLPLGPGAPLTYQP